MLIIIKLGQIPRNLKILVCNLNMPFLRVNNKNCLKKLLSEGEFPVCYEFTLYMILQITLAIMFVIYPQKWHV